MSTSSTFAGRSLFRLSVLHLALAASFTAYAQQGTSPSANAKKEAPASVTLSTVNVHGQSTAPVKRIDWRSKERSTATDMKGILADEPGVQFGGGKGAAQWVTIRGMGENQVDYVVDDASSDANIFHHQGRFMLDPALVKIINVEKGTGSASSGIGATSGKIEATTVDALDLLREGQDFGFRLNGGLSSPKDEGWQGGFSVYGRSGMVDGLLVGNRVHSDDYKDANGRTVSQSALDGRSFLGKVGFQLREDLRLTVSHRREEEYGLRNLREEFFFDAARDDPADRKRIVSTTTAALRGTNLGFISTMDLNASAIRSKQHTDANNIHPKNSVNIDTNAANLRLSSRLGEQHLVKYGINLRNQKAGNTRIAGTGLGEQKKTDTGFYAEGIWHWSPITLTTGLRYDRFSLTSNEGNKKSDGKVNPSVGLIWDATETLSFSASHNRASRSPRFREVLLTTGPLRFDPNLGAENSRNTELGVDWSKGNFNVAANYFWQKIKNLQNIDGMNCRGRDCAYHLVSSHGELTNKGYEINARYDWQNLTARIGTAYSEPELNGTTVDKTSTAIPMGRQWTTSLTYKLPSPNLEFGWRGRYAQKGEYMDASRGSGTAVSRAGYGVHDLYLTWLPMSKDTLTVNFAVDNVGNKFYRSQSQRSGDSALAEAGRAFRMNVHYRY